MAPTVPQPGFNYTASALHGNWHLKYLKTAYPPSVHAALEQFIEFCKELVKQEGLRPSAYKHLPDAKKQLQEDRKAMIPKITSEYPHHFEVVGYPGFRDKVIRGVLAYASNWADKDRVKSETPALNDPQLTAFNVSPQVAQHTFEPPSADWFSECSLVVFPPQSLSGLLPIHMMISRVCQDVDLGVRLTASHARFDKLWQPINKKFNLEAVDCEYQLAYKSVRSGTVCGILDDQDLQDCIQSHFNTRKPEIFIETLPLGGPRPSTTQALTEENLFGQYEDPSVLKSRALTVSSRDTSLTNTSTSPTPPPATLIKRSIPTDDHQSDDSSLSLTGRRAKRARTKTATPPERTPTTSSDEDQSTSSFVVSDDSDPDTHTDRTTSEVPLEKRRHVARPSSAPSDELQEVEQDTGIVVNSEIGELDEIIDKKGLLPEGTFDDEDEDDEEEDPEARLQRILDSKACEHINEWEPCCAAFRILQPGKSDRDMKRYLPFMKEGLKDWQLLCVYVVVIGCGGDLGVFGKMIGDIPGLGKTWIAIAIAIIYLLLLEKWREIEAEWAEEPTTRKHCPKNAKHDAECPTDSKFFSPCPCQPSAPFHKCRPLDGPTLFEVPPGNIKQWRKEMRRIVDLEALGVELCVVYDGYPADESFSRFQQTLKTEISAAEKNRRQKKSQYIVEEAAWGVPKPESSNIWILTAWNTFNKREEYFNRIHTRKWTENHKLKTKDQKLYMFHAGLVIVDEAHRVKTPAIGHWKSPASMKKDRPSRPFWLVPMSGTIVHSGPTDLLAIMELFYHKSWDDEQHPLHVLRPASLKVGLRLLKNEDESKGPERKDFMDRFALALPYVLIRRNEYSLWFGKELIPLPPLYLKEYTTKLPNAYRSAHEQLVARWQAVILGELRAAQRTWDANQHKPAYLHQHPNRPTRITAKNAVNGTGTEISSAARLLRLCSTLPSLAESSHTYPEHKWTNAMADIQFINTTTGKMKQGCILDLEWSKIKHSPKLIALGKLMKIHPGEHFLVMTSFVEVAICAQRWVQEATPSQKLAIFIGNQKHRDSIIDDFMGYTDDHGKDFAPTNDGLTGTAGTLGTGHNLTRATVVVLTEPIFEVPLYKQIPKRAHRCPQKKPVYFYTITTDTAIESYVTNARVRKEGFGDKAFEAKVDVVEVEKPATGVKGVGEATT
ncbi:MAG: hypothetical protein Q9204_001569 [Flavoplaca sp. TL-2023a]